MDVYNIPPEGSVSQILDLCLSSHFMYQKKEEQKKKRGGTFGRFFKHNLKKTGPNKENLRLASLQMIFIYIYSKFQVFLWNTE